ncbi:MAG: hypothetical protein IJ433_00605 [Ruminococcus sp.]|nr:hypothetical protein [Ruminococcus sp.]
MKRFFAFILTLTLLFAMSVQAFSAESNFSYKVIQDDSITRIATEYIDGVKYVYTFDKVVYELTTQTFDETGTMTSTKLIRMPELGTGLPTGAIGVASCEYTHGKETYLNFSYKQVGPLEYKLTNNGVTVYRSFPIDSLAIQNYAKAVDDLKAAEIAVTNAGGLIAVWAINAYSADDLTAGALATALGISYADVVALIQAVDNCNSVWAQYIE